MAKFIERVRNFWEQIADFLGLGGVHPTITLDRRWHARAALLHRRRNGGRSRQRHRQTRDRYRHSDAAEGSRANGAASTEAATLQTTQPTTSYDIEAKCISAHMVRLWRVYDHLYHWTHGSWLSMFWPTSKGRRDIGDSKDWSAAMLDPATENPNIKDANSVEATNAFLLATGRLRLAILSTDLLPLLYGLLGACAFVLRSVTTEVKVEIFSGPPLSVIACA